MDIGKIEDWEVNDEYQPNKKRRPCDMDEEEVFDSRLGEILEQDGEVRQEGALQHRSDSRKGVP